MKRLILVVLALLVFSVGASGQSYTTVTATVTDSSSAATVYINGSYGVTLVNTSGQQALLGGNPNFQQTFSGQALTSTGTLSIVLPSVTAMSPSSGLQWKFSICANPQQVAGVFPTPALPCFTYTSTGTQISGASVDISASLKAVAATIPLPSGGSSTATNGVGGSANPASPVLGDYVVNSCPVANTGHCYFTSNDVKEDDTCSWTNASTTITCSDGPFLPIDCVGGSGCTGTGTTKHINGGQSCGADGTSADYGGQMLTTADLTIATYISATQVTVSSNPANTATFSGSFPQGACAVWGHYDDAAMVTLDAAYASITTTPTCPRTFIAGYYFLQNPHWYVLPAACAIGPGQNGIAGAFTTTLPSGWEIEGVGPGPTKVYMSGSFPNGDACHHVPSTLVSSSGHPFQTGACWSMPVGTKWKNWMLTGGWQGTAPNIASKTLGPYMFTGSLQNWTCMNMGMYTGSTAGIELAEENWLTEVNNAGCGGIGIYVDQGGALNLGYRVVVESAGVDPLYLAGPNASFPGMTQFDCFGCLFANANNQPFGAFPTISNQGANLALYNTHLQPWNNNRGANSSSGINSYTCAVAGCKAYFNNVYGIGNTAGGASTNNGGIVDTAAGTEILTNTVMAAQANGSPFTNVVGGVMIDNCSNTFTGGTASVGGTIVNSSCSGNNVPVTAAKLVLSAGWGASAAITALSGGNAPIQFTITNTGAGQAASPTITYTFPTPYLVAPYSCTAVDIGGNNPLLNPFTTSSLTKTGAVFTATGTPTVSDTEIMNITCVTP